MKKSLFLGCMMLIVGNVFGQVHFSVDGSLATDFTYAAPTLGLQINFEKLDVLAGTKFWFYNSDRTDANYETFNTNNRFFEYRFEFFAGLAPKVVLTERWSLSFPILAEISFRKDELKYDSEMVYSVDTIKESDYFSFGFDVGSRVYYSLNEKWNIYLGFLFQIMDKTNITNTYWKNSANTTYIRKQDNMLWFGNGELELGVRFTF